MQRIRINEDNAYLDFSASHIQNLIMELASLSNDEAMASPYKFRYQGLTQQHAKNNYNWKSEDELEEIISSLQFLMSTTESPPPSLVAEVHSMVGVIYQRLNQDMRAIQSFLQVLWVLSSCDRVSSFLLGLTRTRLALAYGRTGKYNEAIDLLEMALTDFKKEGLHPNHQLVVRASDALQGFQMAVIHRTTREDSWRRLHNNKARAA